LREKKKKELEMNLMNNDDDLWGECASESDEVYNENESSESEGEPFEPHQDYQRGITFDESEAYIPETS
jgi:hypothetical protein